MENTKVTLEGNLCSNILYSFEPYIRFRNIDNEEERVSINLILSEFFFESELLQSNDSIWCETMGMFKITIERVY